MDSGHKYGRAWLREDAERNMATVAAMEMLLKMKFVSVWMGGEEAMPVC